MDEVLGLLAVPLAGVLIVAGVSKVAAPARLADSMRAVAGGGAKTTAVARAVGVLELAAAVLVSLPGTAAAGAVLGIATGLGIAGWVTLALRRRVTASCGCFGGNLGKPLSAANLLAGLALAAGFSPLTVGYVPAWGAASQLAAAASCALLIVLTMRFRDFYPLLRKGLGAGQ